MALPSENTQRFFRQTFPNEEQLFPYFAGDVISSILPGDSALMAWLPKQPTNNWNIDVHHLIGLWGDEFDGSQTYLEWVTENGTILADPAECNYGDGAMAWAHFSYKYEMARVSVSNESNPLNVFDKGGMQQYENQASMPRIRGEFAGRPITNDAELTLALNGRLYFDHIHQALDYGDTNIKTKFGWFDGMDVVNSVGWVSNHVIGGAPAQFADPRVINGADIADVTALVRRIEFEFWRTYRRVASRTMAPTGDDIVVRMPEAIWDMCARAISTGVLTRFVDIDGLQINTDLSAIRDEEQRIRTFNGDGSVLFGGFIPSRGYNIPVLIDDTTAVNTVLLNGNPAVTGDVQILCKRAFGENILALYYLDWRQIPGAIESQAGETPIINENGLMRIKRNWTNTNHECYFWSIDSRMGLGSRYAPAQCVIHDITLEVDYEDEIEAANWTHPNYYVFEGETGGVGNSLLVATNE